MERRKCERCKQLIEGIIYKALFSQKEYCSQCKANFKKMSFMVIDDYPLYEKETKIDPTKTYNVDISSSDSFFKSL